MFRGSQEAIFRVFHFKIEKTKIKLLFYFYRRKNILFFKISQI